LSMWKKNLNCAGMDTEELHSAG